MEKLNLKEEHEEIDVALITVSDRCSAGTAQDESGPALAKFLLTNPWFPCQVIEQKCIPDDEETIRNTLLKMCEMPGAPQLLLTTGGTGFAERDVTPEATKSVIMKEAPGLVIAMIQKSLEVTPMAMLSRTVCGIRNKTLIINLPGSPKGSLECLGFLGPSLRHAIDLIGGKRASAVAKLHSAACSHHHQQGNMGSMDVHRVAHRLRQSPYPAIGLQESLDLVINVAQQAFPLPVEHMPFSEALGRILAEDIFAMDPLPPFEASIKDGYAVLASDGIGVRKVLGDSTAGSEPKCLPHVTSGTCVRINTGAPLPKGADAMVQVENTKLVAEADDGQTELEVEILVKTKPGTDIRPVGSDIQKGQKVLIQGCKLGYSELGVLATVGATHIAVRGRPKVAMLSTGNELVDPEVQELPPGKIRDSNKTVLRNLLKEYGFLVMDLGIADDSLQGLMDRLRSGFDSCDVIVSTGGVSMGEKDLLKFILIKHFSATLHFGRVFMKPGLPTTFCSLQYKGNTKFVFALPGNPVSATVTCNLYVIPALRTMEGHPHPKNPLIKVKLGESIQLDVRPEFQRVVIHWAFDEELPVAHVTGGQISSRLLSLRSANGLLLLPPKMEALQVMHKGEIVRCMLIGQIFN